MRFDLDLPKWKWPFYVVRHPFEGYDDLRWKKGYSMRAALIIVLLFFIANVLSATMSGFLFGGGMIKIFNIVPYFSSTVVLFFVWVIANWALTTLFDGEGSMKNICCVTAYALIPYVASSFVTTFLSNFLLRTEGAFLDFIYYLGLLWSVILVISGMKVVHQYSLPKTIAFILLTILGMVVVLFISILLITMIQQVFVFGYSIYTELLYRFSL